MAKEHAKYKNFKAKLLENDQVRQEYEALEPQFKIIRQMIALRNELNMSQLKLARKIGTKQSAISRIESGSANVSFGTWYKIAKALDAEIEITLKPNVKTRDGKLNDKSKACAT